MHINDGQISQIIKGHRMTFTYLEYGYNLEIFYTNIYSELSFKLYIFSFIYCLYIYIQTHLAVALITNIFIQQSTVLRGEEVKI